VETVEGGGIVVLLLSSLNSLTQLYSLTMDVHARLATEAHAGESFSVIWGVFNRMWPVCSALVADHGRARAAGDRGARGRVILA
jgi:tRNA(Met) C34 N-acetyltransferase TmcA